MKPNEWHFAFNSQFATCARFVRRFWVDFDMETEQKNREKDKSFV